MAEYHTDNMGVKGSNPFWPTMEKAEIIIRPKNEILGDCGYVWEHFLSQKGWNELDEKDKYGVVIGCYRLKGGGTVCDVYFPALDLTEKNIFTGEVVELTEIEKKEINMQTLRKKRPAKILIPL